MKRQLKDLVMLQELDSLLEEVEGEETRRREAELGFALGETGRLRAERAAIAARLRPEFLRRYERVRTRHARAVVPTRDGICTGCFTVRATAQALARHDDHLEICERCDRILFRLE